MSEETAATATETEAETAETEQSVPYERFKQANSKAKEAADRAKALEKQMADLKSQLEEREQAGLPELERLKKDMEKAQKRAEEAEQRAQDADAKVQRTQKERWVTTAAKDFADPADAAAFLNLDDIEDERDAERAVKGLAKQKPHLLKAEEPKIPGRVLENGRQVDRAADQSRSREEEEGSMILDGIKQLQRNWQSAGNI